MLEESRPVEGFEFIGGHICLDFINTLSDRWRDAPVEVLDTYSDVLTWSHLAHILDSAQVRQLPNQAEQQPELADNWLAEGKQLRALLTRLVSPPASGEAVPADELCQFNQLLAQMLPHLSLVPQHEHLAWQWKRADDLHALPLWYVIRDTADLLTSPDIDRLRVCASENCDWLFMDTSKNHSRRWCDIRVCGNRAKARRYYDRKVTHALI